jgi:hypothetical protein
MIPSSSSSLKNPKSKYRNPCLREAAPAKAGRHQGGGEFFRELDASQLCCGDLHYFDHLNLLKFQISRFEFVHLIRIKPSSRFSAEKACIDIFLEKRTGPIFGIPKAFIKHLHDG